VTVGVGATAVAPQAVAIAPQAGAEADPAQDGTPALAA
jgi:hypothetical protein